MSHTLDQNTLLCSCGKTKEQHMNIELCNEKIAQKWLDGDVDLQEDFACLDRALTAHLTTPRENNHKEV